MDYVRRRDYYFDVLSYYWHSDSLEAESFYFCWRVLVNSYLYFYNTANLPYNRLIVLLDCPSYA